MKRYKFLAPCLLVIVIAILGVFILPTKAQAIKISGNYTISVAGDNCIITDFRDDISGSLVIPPYLSGYKVVGIEENAFYHCLDLTYISIPSTVTYIDDYAFADCVNVEDFYIPSSVTTIGAHAFSGCASVCSFYLPNSVTAIGDYAFSACHNITEFTIPDSVKTVGTGVFENCKALESITIGRGVTSMGYMGDGCVAYTDLYIKDPNAWCNVQFANSGYNPANYCKTTHILDENGNEVQNLVLDSTVTQIPIFTFNHCTNLTSVAIPESVTSVDKWAFLECTNMTRFRVDGDNTVYSTDDKGVLLSKDKKTLILAPKGISGSYILPDSVTAIDVSAFDKCNKLQTVIIPKGVTVIGSYAFRKCTGLQSITIPYGVNTIEQVAFSDCTNLNDVYYAGSKADWEAISIADNNNCLTDANIHYNHIHDYTLLPAVTVKPTCTEAGYVEYTCVYGETYTEILDALGHEYTGSATVVKPTCTESGHAVTQCIRCTDTKTTYQGRLGHDYSGTKTVIKPTCTEQGYTVTQCIRCDSIEESDYAVALGHDYSGTETVVSPTCTEQGYTMVQCIRCDSTENKDYTDEIGHQMVLIPATGPTCTEPGLTAGTACRHCGMVGVEQKETEPATGHSYEYNLCVYCGHIDGELSVDMCIASVVLRPSCTGLYFEGSFGYFYDHTGVGRYGIAVSVYNKLPVADGSDETSLYTVGHKSVLISNILGDGKNGKTLIYARPYALLVDGTYIYGDVVATNLKTLVETVDSKLFEELGSAAQTALNSMYLQFTAAMQDWLIPNIKKFGEE